MAEEDRMTDRLEQAKREIAEEHPKGQGVLCDDDVNLEYCRRLAKLLSGSVFV